MLFAVIGFFVMLGLLDRATRRGRQKLNHAHIQYKYYAQRDELRRAAIKGIAPINVCFYAMDGLITQAIECTSSLNLLEIAGGYFARRNDPAFIQDFQFLVSQLALPENAPYQIIFQNVGAVTVEAIAIKHPIARYTLKNTDKIARSGQYIRNTVNRVKEAAIFAVTRGFGSASPLQHM